MRKRQGLRAQMRTWNHLTRQMRDAAAKAATEAPPAPVEPEPTATPSNPVQREPLPPLPEPEALPIARAFYMATGVFWADTSKERNGDYPRIAHCFYGTSELVVDAPRSKHLAAVREHHAKLVADGPIPYPRY